MNEAQPRLDTPASDATACMSGTWNEPVAPDQRLLTDAGR